MPLKTAYKKLRLLVDRGCIFVGHGLASDFRIISESHHSHTEASSNSCLDIFVPPEQIIDTVSIYYLPARQRKLSLRLLAWLVLDQDVQSAGTHDSIEDARTALQLYQEHEKMLAEDVWEDELERFFREGKQLVSFSLFVFGSSLTAMGRFRTGKFLAILLCRQNPTLHRKSR